MQVMNDPPRENWNEILSRPVIQAATQLEDVRLILSAVKSGGDVAVKKHAAIFDGYTDGEFLVPKEKIQEAEKSISKELKEAIRLAARNIEEFHSPRLQGRDIIETMPGIRCWKKNVGIDKVGLYIPGGTAPLFSTVLMLGIPARLAGCKQILLCTPARNGVIHPAILFAASVAGITEIYGVGGVQAIAAMAYGTESIPRVDKIFGPGNSFVTLAKQLVQMDGVAIDMPAGPSELCVVATEGAPASFIAADLLSQAEHGADSQVILISTSESLIDEVIKELETQLKALPRAGLAEKALRNSKAIFIPDLRDAMEMMNEYAPEHLLLIGENAERMSDEVRNAGSVFIGKYSPEAAGDYATGTNHTLPTSGYARAYSGVSTASFQKTISFQQLTREGLESISGAVKLMAEEEGLAGHARSIGVRAAGRNVQ